MHTSHEHDDDLPYGDCGCGSCAEQDEFWIDDDDVYDDPYEVVMYDIDAEADDLYALLDMLSDSARSWYARRRLNALAASGQFSDLVAAIIIDSLGRRWNPLEHPRDRFGQFIETGGFLRWVMGGVNLRGQVSRIDSDGRIHVRSLGNDSIQDGAIVRFDPKQASKLIRVADPVADLTPGRELSPVDLDADIPDFPEASATQRRIYNALQQGDMPAADLDAYRASDDSNISGTDFASELKGLQDRGLIEIDSGDDDKRVRRSDNDDLGVRNISDDEIDEIGEDETPDLEDSPALTKAQRDLLDRITDLHNDDSPGVLIDELENDGYDPGDLEALINSGVVNVSDKDDRFLFLENPEGDGDSEAAPKSETDISNEIFEASKVLNDEDAQEAFQHYAEELARPGDENNMPLPEDLAGAKRRNAEAAANKWWEERNAGTLSEDGDVDAPESDAPEVEQANPNAALNPQNQALADALAEEWIPDEKYLDSAEGIEYRYALKRFFDAEDLDEAGFSDHARIKRDDATRALRKIDKVTEEDIAGWPDAVREARLADREQVVPDATPEADIVPEVAEDVVPEPDAAEALRQAVHGVEQPELFDDLPESSVEEIDASEEVVDEAVLEEGGTITPDWKDFDARLAEEEKADEFFARLDQENRIAEELGLDLHGSDAPWSWEALAEGIGFRPAELLFNDSNGSLGEALAKDPDPFIRQYENELLQKFLDAPDDLGPEVMRLRQAGLIKGSPGGNDWVLTDAGRERMGLIDELPGDDGLNIEEASLPDEAELQRDRDASDAARALRRDFDADQALEEADARGTVNDVLDEESDSLEINTDDLDRVLAEEELDANLEDEQALFIPEVADLVPAAEKPAHARIIDQPDFFENKPDLSQEGDVLDRNGRPVVLGGWYKANRGGEGDPDQVVGFLNQDKYPGLVLVQTPDGKMKIVDAQGKGPLAGLNRMPDPGTDVRERIRVQRAVGGDEILNLDQNNPKNVLWAPRGEQGVMAEIGMRVKGRGDKGLFQDGDEGIIVRIGWNAGQNRPDIFVIKPGHKKEMKLAPRSLVPILEGTVVPPSVQTPTPDAPNADPNNLPDREWPVPSDQELLARMGDLGGQVEFIPFNNAHQNPGVVYEQVMSLVDRGQLEIVPGDGAGGRLMISLPGGGEGAPDAGLPAGANNALEAELLGKIDAAGDVELRRSELLRADDDDIGDQFDALDALIDRGVVERGVDADGRPTFRRVPETTPVPEQPNGADNELEGDLLNIIDANGEGGAVGGDLVDLDSDDAADRMQALRALVDRGVLQRTTDGEGGRPVYRRVPTAASGSRTHDPSRGSNAGSEPMNHKQAVDALRGGADPMTVNTTSLHQAMKDSGRFEFRAFKKDGNVGATQYAIDNQVSGPFSINASGQSVGRVYVIKLPRETNPRGNWRSELYAGGISQSVGLSDGDPGPDTGGLFQPQTTSASRNQVIMEHFAYKFPQGTEFPNAVELTRQEKKDLAADRIRLALYDFMINNSLDRHSYNQVYARLPDGSLRVLVIDNGMGDGENYAKTDPDMDFAEFVRRAGRNKTADLIKDVGDFNNGLTRAELRDIVQSFYSRYGNIDPAALLESLSRNNELDASDLASLRTWVDAAKSRVQSLDSNTESIVNVLATIIGV